MKKIIIKTALIILIFSHLLFAQSTEIDSLKLLLNRSDDSLKVRLLLKIYEEYEQGRILLGKEYLDQALEITEELNNDIFKANVLMKYGNFYNITGNFEKAVDKINEAKVIFEEGQNFSNVGSAYNNLGATYEKLGKYDEAMDNLIKALNIYESQFDSLNIAKSFLNLGLLYSRQEDYKKSLELYNKSLEIRENLEDKEGIALLYNNMAIVNYNLNDFDNVRSYFEKAYNIYVESGNLRRQLMALSNIAEINNIIGQKEKALATYFKILELDKELGHKGELAQTHYQIGSLYESRNDFRNAKKHFYLSIEIANNIGALVDIKDAYGQLMEIFKIENNFEKALEYNELYLALNDSIFNAEKSRQIQEIETKYETKKKEQQIINLENEKIIKDLKIKKQRIFLFSFFAGFISIFTFLLILFAQIKRIRKVNSILEYQKTQITESIEYASRIQTAILPPGDYITSVIPEHFILYKPRDIVSGDFYWISHKDGKTIVAAVDCTGHGVPGAFMSMLGFAFLNEIVNTNVNLSAGEILNRLRNYVKKSLHQTGKDDEAKDGMDIALCIIDTDNRKLQYSGAYNPLYLIRNNDFISLTADRMPIGIHIAEKKSFTNHEMDIQKGDVIYIFTDGYIDQFGGSESKKYKLSQFKKMLMNITKKPMNEQKEILEVEFNMWKGEIEQIDDVLVMGIKI